MRKCGAIKANGERCGRIVGPSQVYCYAHDPSNADKRRRDAAKAGRSSPNTELKEIKASIKELTDRVLKGAVETGPAAIANQLMNTRLRIHSAGEKVEGGRGARRSLGGPRERAQKEEDGMRNDDLKKLYDRLSPEERFKLVIEAIARGDETECRNLVESCPRVVYEMNDMAYEDLVRSSEKITTLVCLDLAPRLIKLRMFAGFSGVLASLRNTCLYEAHSAYLRGRAVEEKARRGAHSKDHPRGRRNPEPESADALGKITSRIEEEWSGFEGLVGGLEEGMRIEVVAVWEAFSSFSREEMAVEPKTLIKAWFEPMLGEIEAVEETLDTTETNPQRLQEYTSDLRQLWRKLVA